MKEGNDIDFGHMEGDWKLEWLLLNDKIRTHDIAKPKYEHHQLSAFH